MTCIAVLMCNLCILVKYESFSSVASILNYNKNLNLKLQKQRGFYSLFIILYFNHENEKKQLSIVLVLCTSQQLSAIVALAYLWFLHIETINKQCYNFINSSVSILAEKPYRSARSSSVVRKQVAQLLCWLYLRRKRKFILCTACTKIYSFNVEKGDQTAVPQL